MNLYQLAVRIKGLNQPLSANFVTGRGLHGLLYNIIEKQNPDGATKLHKLAAPKAYTIAPYYNSNNNFLTGFRLTCLDAFTGELFIKSWEHALKNHLRLHLGRQTFQVDTVEVVKKTTFETLLCQPSQTTIGLRFLSPTAFKQGGIVLPLPVPRNVFSRPFVTWNKFAPSSIKIPKEWLEWCFNNIQIAQLNIETASINLGKQASPFVGYIGDVWFKSKSTNPSYLSILHALAQFTVFFGVGYKTTMGGGVTEAIEP